MEYIEQIIFFNVVIHLVFIFTSNLLVGVKGHKFLIIISILIDAVYVVLYLLIPYKLEKYTYLFVIFISSIPFIRKNIKEMMLLVFIYYIQNFCLGGISEIIYVSNFFNFNQLLLLLFLIIVFVLIYKNKYCFNIHMAKNKFEILITFENKKYKFKGFLDTGNLLTDEAFIPVVFLNSKQIIGRYVKKIDVQTVAIKRKMELYKVDEFYIKEGKRYIKKDVYIAYSSLSFDAMFGPSLIGGLK